jgi:hypothetical protein
MIQVVSTAVPFPVEVIVEVCRRHRVAELAVFRSEPGSNLGPERIIDAARMEIAATRGSEFGDLECIELDPAPPVSRMAPATAAVG